jgi:hypothetical protein
MVNRYMKEATMPRFSTATDNIREQLGSEETVTHSAACDRVSAGDACVGGCLIEGRPDVEADWLKIGFEVNDGMFAYIVTDVNADTIETFDTEGVVDTQSHEEWHYAVTEMLKDGGAVAAEPILERLKEWTDNHPSTFPIERLLKAVRA